MEVATWIMIGMSEWECECVKLEENWWFYGVGVVCKEEIESGWRKGKKN